MIFSFLSGAVIAATLGPYARGLYQSWRIFLAIFSDISNFGLGKFISSKFNIESSTFKGVGKHLLLIYLIATALIPLMINLNFTKSMILIFFLLIPVGIFTDIYFGLLIRNEKYSVVALWSLLAMGGSSLLTILLFFIQKLTLDSVIISSSIVFALCLILGLKNIGFPNGNRSIYINYIKIIPIYLSNLFKTFFIFLDQMLVLYFLNLVDLGIFAMAIAVAGISSIITVPVSTISPSIAKKWDNRRIRVLIQILACYVVLILLAILICHNLLGMVILKTIGYQFLPIVEIVPILFAGKLFQSFVQLLISWSIYRNESKILLMEKLLNAVGLLIASTLFFSSKTIEVAAWVSIVTLLPSFTFFFFLYFKETRKT
jgi:O-antigen/teichoic acid export membrane protein